MDIIKNACDEINLGLKESDFDRCHRDGSVFTAKNDKTYQTILLKLRSWHARDVIYKNLQNYPLKWTMTSQNNVMGY